MSRQRKGKRRDEELKRVQTTYYPASHHRDLRLVWFGLGMLAMAFTCALILYGSGHLGW